MCRFQGEEGELKTAFSPSTKFPFGEYIEMHHFQIYSPDFVTLNVPLISHEFSVNVKSNRELSMYVICD